MATKSIHEVKTHLSRLVEDVLAGEEIIISRSGEPVAVIVPYRKKKRKGGIWKGKVKISKNFEELPEEYVELFYKGSL